MWVIAVRYITWYVVACIFFVTQAFAAATTPGEQDFIRDRQDRLLQEQRQRLEELKKLPGEQARPSARAAMEDARCFTIQRIDIQGADTLGPAQRTELVQPYLGQCLGVAQLNELLGVVTDRYLQLGLVTSRAYLPQQDLSTGILTLQVVEGRLEGIRPADDSGLSPREVNMAFPGHVGELLNLREVEQLVDQLNRLPSNGAQMELAPGEAVGGSTVLVRNAAQKPWRASLSRNNDGQRSTGQQQWGTLINRSGIIESDSFFNITAANLDNQGGTLRALGTDGASVYHVGGVLDNQGGVIEIANADLTVDAGSFRNTNGSLLHVGLGEFNISSANVTAAGGSLVTRGGLTLNADSWTNSGVLQAGRLTLKVGNFHQTASGQLLASQSLSGEGLNWSNDGKLASDGDLWLGLSGTYSGNGRVTSLGNLQIDAAQLQLATPASITSGAGLRLGVGGTLLNRGRITSVDDAGITAGSIDNYGTLGSAQSLTLKTGALLNERGLLFSGGDMGLQVDTFTNRYADFYSLANLRIDRDGNGGHASLIRNSSSTLQSDGNMSLAASTIENVREVLTVNDAGIYTGKIYQVACIEGVNAGDCSGKRNFVFEVLERQKLEVTQASQASSITAGSNLSFNGGDLLNQSSTIATGGNLNASVTNLFNLGIETGDTEYVRTFRTNRQRGGSGLIGAANAFNEQYWLEGARYDANNLSGLEAGISNFLAHTETELPQYARVTQLATTNQRYAAVIQAVGRRSKTGMAQTGASSRQYRLAAGGGNPPKLQV